MILFLKLFIQEFLSSVKIFDFIGFLQLYTNKFNCIFRHCGEDKSDDIVTTAEVLTVVFSTDVTVLSQGFKAQYTIHGMHILSLRYRLTFLVSNINLLSFIAVVNHGGGH